MIVAGDQLRPGMIVKGHAKPMRWNHFENGPGVVVLDEDEILSLRNLKTGYLFSCCLCSDCRYKVIFR